MAPGTGWLDFNYMASSCSFLLPLPRYILKFLSAIYLLYINFSSGFYHRFHVVQVIVPGNSHCDSSPGLFQKIQKHLYVVDAFFVQNGPHTWQAKVPLKSIWIFKVSKLFANLHFHWNNHDSYVKYFICGWSFEVLLILYSTVLGTYGFIFEAKGCWAAQRYISHPPLLLDKAVQQQVCF